MSFRVALKLAVPLLFVVAVFAATESAKTVTVKGYVLDSACAFTKSLKKPVSSECAIACAKNGSPLVIMAPTGTIYFLQRTTAALEGRPVQPVRAAPPAASAPKPPPDPRSRRARAEKKNKKKKKKSRRK